MPRQKKVCLSRIFTVINLFMNTFQTVTAKIETAFSGASDLVVREIKTDCISAKLYFLDAMCDTEQLELTLIRPVTAYSGEKIDFERLKGIVYSGCNIKESEIPDGITALAGGDAVLCIDGMKKVVVFAVRKGIFRGITEPPTGSVIKGPREGFVENIKTNMVLIRRRIRSDSLVIDCINVGRYSDTAVAVCYVKGIAKQSIADEIKKKLQEIDVDGIVDSSYLTKVLEMRPYSLFKQVGNTEKPDVAAEKMLDGRVIIMVDGSPIVLTLPFILIEDFDGAQDLYKRSSRATFLRVVRIFAVFMAVILPAVYVATQIHQYQILPLQLLIKILGADNDIPFTPTVEMLLALLLFEILGEASIRMPRHVGMALSVVGAIVLGETAVNAGLLSSVTVLIVALSGIGIYAVPDEVGTLGILRVILVIASGLFGVYGIILSLIAIFAYLSGMETFSVPYLAPFAPIENEDLRNTFIVPSYPDDDKRTQSLDLKNTTKLNAGGNRK